MRGEGGCWELTFGCVGAAQECDVRAERGGMPVHPAPR
jgi:hypothetical protein